jgi:hypothetical protein
MTKFDDATRNKKVGEYLPTQYSVTLSEDPHSHPHYMFIKEYGSEKPEPHLRRNHLLCIPIAGWRIKSIK